MKLTKIRFFRDQLGMTRKELADGVCDESTLYRIEMGQQTPSLEVLLRISKKLNVSLDDLLHNQDDLQIDKYKEICRELAYNQQYIELSLVVQEFEEKVKVHEEYKDNVEISRFITWQKRICKHKQEEQHEEALSLLKSIYNPHLLKELDIFICNSIGMVCLDKEGVHASFPYFQKAYYAAFQVKLKDKKIIPIVGYNLAYCYYYKGNLEKAIFIAYETLSFLERNQLSFMLGKTTHMLGMLYKKQGEIKESLSYLRQSKFFFEFEAKGELVKKVKQDIEDLLKEE
ncbi:helix-turn-helix domain-containing protein [Bacillus sp. AK128]